MIYKHLVFFIIAPKSISVVGKTSRLLNVTFFPASRTGRTAFYKAVFDARMCEVSATASPLSCLLPVHLGGTKYRVQGFACVSASDCSYPTPGEGATLPDSKEFC